MTDKKKLGGWMRLWTVASALWSFYILLFMGITWFANGDFDASDTSIGVIIWLAPPAFLLGLGLALNWFYRGFTDSN